MTSGRMFALNSSSGVKFPEAEWDAIKEIKRSIEGESLRRFVRVVGSSKVGENLSVRMQGRRQGGGALGAKARPSKISILVHGWFERERETIA